MSQSVVTELSSRNQIRALSREVIGLLVRAMTEATTISAAQMKKIVAEISSRDQKIAKVIATHPLCTIGRNPKPVTHFEALVESVISQQLAVKAADTI